MSQMLLSVFTLLIHYEIFSYLGMRADTLHNSAKKGIWRENAGVDNRHGDPLQHRVNRQVSHSYLQRSQQEGKGINQPRL